MKAVSNYSLGPLPWSEDVLREAYFRNFNAAQKAIQEHPGYVPHRDLGALQLSLDIFFNAISELFDSINAFRLDAESPGFWTRAGRDRLKTRELAVRRGLFTAAPSAWALVDHSRRIKKRVSIAENEYKNHLEESFNKNEQ